MTDPNKLVRLLEAAKGENRELDRMIHRYAYPDHEIDGPINDPVFRLPNSIMWVNVPYYTAFLDPADDLSNWVLLHASDIGADGLAQVELGNPKEPGDKANGIHSRLAIAWCIAAIIAIRKDRENGT